MSELQQFSSALQAGGYRLTRARKLIFETLLAGGGHMSAADVAAAVQRREPSVARMTVYRTLELLRQLGLAQPVYQGSGAAHYVLMDNGHHHHLLCSGCDQVIEFDDCVAQEISRRLGERFDFEIQGHLIEFYGLCGPCRAGRAPAK